MPSSPIRSWPARSSAASGLRLRKLSRNACWWVARNSADTVKVKTDGSAAGAVAVLGAAGWLGVAGAAGLAASGATKGGRSKIPCA